jgi:hypothetical protein
MLGVEQRQLRAVAGRYLRRFDQRESFCPLDKDLSWEPASRTTSCKYPLVRQVYS